MVDPSQRFLSTVRHVFSRVEGPDDWLILRMDARRARLLFPPHTVIIYPAPGPPQTFFDGRVYIITTPVVEYAYTAFTLALAMLTQLGDTQQLDMVAVLPFGPPNPDTARQMHDAYTWHCAATATHGIEKNKTYS